MPRTRRLLRDEQITYSVAQEQETNILHQLGYPEQQSRFFAHLHARQDWMKAIVAHHLGLHTSAVCHVADEAHWLSGSFNVFVPVTIDGWNGTRVLIRFPLPYRVGESVRPGNGDEKIRCEAGTYAWLQENCSDIPIPCLYGFALSTGETFTRLESLPIPTRSYQVLRRRILTWLGYPVSKYVRHQIANHTTLDGVVGSGYLLVEYIEETQGQMLSGTWVNGQHNAKLRRNLFRANRPLSMEVHQLENENIPTYIPRDYTYSTVDSYITDMLSLHDSRFRHQPNAINDLGDCGYQLSALSTMRTIFSSLFRRDFRRGPFSLTLTDLHQSNIFVDAEWNITCLVDLEWACSMPMEMISPPHWLTNKAVDQLDAAEYDAVRMEFMKALVAEEKERELKSTALGMVGNSEAVPRLSDVMSQAWATGTFWYTLALSSPSGLFSIFHKHVRPLFCANYGEEFNLIMPFFWERNIGYIAARKLSDKREYDERLRQTFEDN
ncbi:hypothetical protein P170DRAFT_509909 [Aspergillus steynii IBT 23096]|uniref:Aminoglycoside phosphotransferase domain-containing protein n=1 Tax=Aspergillus steynii IBT 23096 TaxID=1392250 RepID=A0A2I2G8Z8_9EURO|nr:uncharacterized protein P170DRAFT_509909 [Aspergillus steynii IBT 23096]PLB49351.1 hypothetical protein P170DRAFT_509909 [Aspergillus steynii IBT 23096]